MKHTLPRGRAAVMWLGMIVAAGLLVFLVGQRRTTPVFDGRFLRWGR